MNMHTVPESLLRAPCSAVVRILAIALLDRPFSTKRGVARELGLSVPTVLRNWEAAFVLADRARVDVESYQKEQAARVGIVLGALTGHGG